MTLRPPALACPGRGTPPGTSAWRSPIDGGNREPRAGSRNLVTATVSGIRIEDEPAGRLY
jgi:hypothetical protein